MLMQYKRAQDSAQIRKRGARSAIAAGTKTERVDEMMGLGEWESNDGGSYSEIDSEEEKRRIKHIRRYRRAKREGVTKKIIEENK